MIDGTSTGKPPATRTIRRVNEILIQSYGQRQPSPRDPLDGIVLIILSQATSDINCDRAFNSLKETFPTWESVLAAPVESVADAIRSGGLANQKAARIQKMLREIGDESGTLDLSWMKTATADECRDFLKKFHGIGPKTIACVLVFFLDKPAFPVDTHVHRIARRLGWVRAKSSAEEAHRVLEIAIPDECKLDLHVNMISHGRTLCRAEGNGGPRCGDCPIRKFCAYGKTLCVKSGATTNPKNRFHGTDFFVTLKP